MFFLDKLKNSFASWLLDSISYFYFLFVITADSLDNARKRPSGKETLVILIDTYQSGNKSKITFVDMPSTAEFFVLLSCITDLKYCMLIGHIIKFRRVLDWRHFFKK